MLKVYFGDMDGVLHNVETFFKNQMEYSCSDRFHQQDYQGGRKRCF